VRLRPYQTQAVEGIRDSFSRHQRTLYVLPCGGGKTQIFSHIAAGVAQKNKRVVVLTHRSFLHRQVCEALTSWGVPHGKLVGGSRFLTRAPVTVASVFTLINRLDRFLPPDLIVIDESHHLAPNSNSWHKIVKAFPKAKVLGVTASPIRLDGFGLGDLFQDMVVGPQVIELTVQGYLSPIEAYGTNKQLDLDKVTVRGGDYAPGQLEEAMDKPVITGDAVDHYKSLADRTQAVAFCCSIKHAEDTAAQFRDMGHKAEAVHGKMDQFDIDQVFLRFGRRETQIVTSASLIDEGLDVPAIETVIDLSPTRSLGRYIQKVGRGARISPGKSKTLYLDHAGNFNVHGHYDQIRDWKLAGTTEAQFRAPSTPPARICKFCFAYFRPAPVCPVCGTPVIVDGRTVDHVDGELSQMTSAEDLLAAVELESREKSYEILLKIARGRGMPNPEGWAYAVLAAKTAQDRKAQVAYGERTVNGLSEAEHQALRESVNRAMSKEAIMETEQAWDLPESEDDWARAERIFMAILDDFLRQGHTISASLTSPNYAPKRIARHPDSEDIPMHVFKKTMERLFAAGKIKQETKGRPAHPVKFIVPASQNRAMSKEA
jgi:DNA repair protein RadD